MMSERFFFFLIILSGCVSAELMKLASKYGVSVTFFDHAQQNLREIYSLCDYKEDCFREKATEQINEVLCLKYQEYNFVSEKECQRAGQSMIDLTLGKTELAIPIRNTTQDAHNDRMYELEKERIEQDRQFEQQRYAEQQRQQAEETKRQAEQRLYEMELERQAVENWNRQERERQIRRQERINQCKRAVDSKIESDIAKATRDCISERLANRRRHGQLQGSCGMLAGRLRLNSTKLRISLKLRCENL